MVSKMDDKPRVGHPVAPPPDCTLRRWVVDTEDIAETSNKGRLPHLWNDVNAHAQPPSTHQQKFIPPALPHALVRSFVHFNFVHFNFIHFNFIHFIQLSNARPIFLSHLKGFKLLCARPGGLPWPREDRRDPVPPRRGTPADGRGREHQPTRLLSEIHN